MKNYLIIHKDEVYIYSEVQLLAQQVIVVILTN